MSEFIQILTTVASKEDARTVADRLVAERLVACVQTDGPIESTYRWEGEVRRDEEWRCVIKTTAEAYDSVSETIEAVHPYDTPEILATPVSDGQADYLQWIDDEVTVE
ncbi:MAG: divalent-cation tolerance protein CutA [Halodesulfurarchaeum sp.]